MFLTACILYIVFRSHSIPSYHKPFTTLRSVPVGKPQGQVQETKKSVEWHTVLSVEIVTKNTSMRQPGCSSRLRSEKPSTSTSNPLSSTKTEARKPLQFFSNSCHVTLQSCDKPLPLLKTV